MNAWCRLRLLNSGGRRGYSIVERADGSAWWTVDTEGVMYYGGTDLPGQSPEGDATSL
jgi:hypothetical protein